MNGLVSDAVMVCTRVSFRAPLKNCVQVAGFYRED